MIFAQTQAVDVQQMKDLAKGSYTTDGILVVVLLILCYGIWRVFKFLAPLVRGLVERAAGHLDTVDATMRALQGSIERIPERLDRIENKVDGLTDRVDRLDSHTFADERK